MPSPRNPPGSPFVGVGPEVGHKLIKCEGRMEREKSRREGKNTFSLPFLPASDCQTSRQPFFARKLPTTAFKSRERRDLGVKYPRNYQRFQELPLSYWDTYGRMIFLVVVLDLNCKNFNWHHPPRFLVIASLCGKDWIDKGKRSQWLEFVRMTGYQPFIQLFSPLSLYPFEAPFLNMLENYTYMCCTIKFDKISRIILYIVHNPIFDNAFSHVSLRKIDYWWGFSWFFIWNFFMYT